MNLAGPDAATVVDSYGDPVAKRTARGGLLSFSISNAKTPTNGTPVRVQLNAAPAGYLPISQTVVLSDTGAVALKVTALRPTTAAQGTQTASQNTTTNGSGATAAPVSVATTSGTSQASLSTGAGAVVRDAQNQPVAGALTATVVSADLTNRSALALLPAGLSANGFGKLSSASVRVPVAVGNFSATVNGQPVGSIESATGVTLTFALSAATNPATGQPWQAGQALDAYRFDVATQHWVADGTFSVASLGGGKFAAQTTRTTVQTTWYAATVLVAQTTSVALTVNRNGVAGQVTAELTQNGFSQVRTLAEGQTATTFTEVPTGAARTITVTYGGNTTQVAATTSENVTVSLTAPPPEVTVTVTPVCPAGKGLYVASFPSLFVYASVAGQNNYFDVGDVSRIATINRETPGNTATKITSVVFKARQFEVGKTYDLFGNFEGSLIGPETRAVTAATINLTWNVDASYCR